MKLSFDSPRVQFHLDWCEPRYRNRIFTVHYIGDSQTRFISLEFFKNCTANLHLSSYTYGIDTYSRWECRRTRNVFT